VSPLWPWSPPPETKRCRYCFEEIPGEAEVCPLCGGIVIRVNPQMAKTLIIVLALVAVVSVFQGILDRTGLDRAEVGDREYARGLEAGREAGRRQGEQDALAGTELRETFPARLDYFLRSRKPAFREGFEKGYVNTYYSAYKRKDRAP